MSVCVRRQTLLQVATTPNFVWFSRNLAQTGCLQIKPNKFPGHILTKFSSFCTVHGPSSPDGLYLASFQLTIIIGQGCYHSDPVYLVNVASVKS